MDSAKKKFDKSSRWPMILSILVIVILISAFIYLRFIYTPYSAVTNEYSADEQSETLDDSSQPDSDYNMQNPDQATDDGSSVPDEIQQTNDSDAAGRANFDATQYDTVDEGSDYSNIEGGSFDER